MFLKLNLILLLAVNALGLAYSQTTYTWNGSTTSAWTTPANWTPAGVPLNTDHVIIVASPNTPTLSANTAVQNFTMTSGTLNLGGFTLTSGGTMAFTAGTIQNGTFSSTSGTLATFTNTTFAASCIVSISAGAITINGGIFNGTTGLTVNGAGGTTGNGNATFNGITTLTNNGTGFFRTNGNMTFNGSTEIICNGSGYMLFELTTGNTYNGNLTLTQGVTSTADIRMGYLGTTNYNGNITINSLSNNYIRFGESATSQNFLNGGTIMVGGSGYSTGTFYLNRFTQSGGTTQNFSLTGTARIFLYNSTFSGNLDITSPDIWLFNSVYNGDVIFNKTGPNTNNTAGGNVFNQTLTLNYTGGPGYWSFGNGTADVYNGDVYANNNSSDRIIFSHNSVGNQFNGNVILTQIGSSVGTALTWGPGTVTIAATKTIQIGGAGFSTGYLYLQGVTQLGSQPINLALTGNASINLGPNSSFGGPLNITSPSILPTGATYNSTASFTKTGPLDNHNNGNLNIFNDDLTITNQGTGYFMVGYNSSDQFNGNVIVSNTSTGGINLGWVNGTGNPTMSAGGTIQIGSGGFASGYLRLGSFNKIGADAINLSMSGADLYIDRPSVPCEFDGAFTAIASSIYVRGGTFNAATSFTKTGTADNHNNGYQNIFNSTLTINQQGTGYFMLGYNSNDLFNDDITVTSVNTGIIYLGYSGGTGSPTLAAGKTVFIGGAGYSQGHLHFGYFTQLGATSMNLAMGSSARLTFRNTLIGGNLVSSSGGLIFENSTFNGTVNMTKTGTNNDACGGSVFNQGAVLSHTGTGNLVSGNNNPDMFHGALNITNSGTDSYVYLAYNTLGNLVDGNLTLTNSGNAAQIRITETTTATLTVNGSTAISNSSGASSSGVYFALNGTVIQNGPLDATITSSGTSSQLGFSWGSASNLDLNGNLSVTNTSTGTTSNMVLGNQGNVDISGSLTVLCSSTGANSDMYLSNGVTSLVTIGGATIITNSGSGSVKRYFIGSDGDINFNGTLTINNTSTATNNGIYLNYSASSFNAYNQNIMLSNTSTDGIRFGQNTGSGTLAANKTITIGGGGFSNGLLYLRNFTQVGPTAQNLIADATARMENFNSNWGGNIDFRAGRITTRETVYQGTTYIEKTGAVDDASAGGNTFMQDTELRNSGSGYFLMGNGSADVFQQNLIFRNTGTNRMYLAYSSIGNSITGDLTVINTGSGSNNDMFFANGTSTLSIGGNTSITNSSTSSTASIYFPTDGTIVQTGNLSLVNSGLAATSQNVLANASSSSLTVHGTTSVQNMGNLTTSRTYIGNSGDIIFNNNLTLQNSSGAINSEIFCNYSSTSSNQYNGNITVENTNASGDGIRFGENTGIGVLAATKTITIGGGGFSAGMLYFRSFTQVGPTPQTLITTGTTHFENRDANWGGNVDFRGARMFTRGTVYQGTAYLEKFGANDDASAGGNTFSGNAELRNTGSGYLLMGNGSPDVFQTDLVMNNMGTSRMYLAYSSAGNSILGNLTMNNTASVNDNSVYFVSTTTGSLSIGGNVSITNNASGSTANVYLPDAGVTTIDGALIAANNGTSTTGQLIFASGGSSSLMVNGGVQITNNGGSTTKRVFFGNNGDITTNGVLHLINNSTATNSEIFCNYSSTSNNLYNENVTLQNTTASSDGIFFGNGNGTAIMASGKTVSIGVGGFIAGTLQFRNFTQLGATAQSITLSGATTTLENYSSVWNGAVTFIAPRHYTRSTTYNNTSYLEKNGANNDASVGGNVYNGDVTFVVSGTGYFMPSNTTGDDHNANATFVKNNTGLLYPAYNSTSTFAGNITINSNTVLTFADAGNGRVEFDGGTAQVVSNTGASTGHIMRRITTSKTASDVTLNTTINVSNNLHLVNGNITTTTTNLLIMLAGSNVTAVSDAAFVNGPLRKIGNTAFDFPVGKAGNYRPISISAPANNAHHFTGEYFAVDPHPTYDHNSLDPTLHHISSCEYWILDRTNGASNVNVTLSWDAASCGVDNLADLRVARWNGAVWKDHGNGGTTGTMTAGSVVTSSAVTSFSPFTLASNTFLNPLPIELISFDATCKNEEVVMIWETKSELQNDFFSIEKSNDAENWKSFKTIDGSMNSNSSIIYNAVDSDPYSDITYYRLSQTDMDGTIEILGVVSVSGCGGLEGESSYSVFPNPSTGVFQFLSTYEENFLITIYDMSGKVVGAGIDIYPGHNTIDLTELNSGVYFANFVVGGVNYSHRIILN